MPPIEVSRRYYHDSYTTTFQSDVVERVIHDDQPAVVLAETFFYPSSGGQPHDTGTLGGRRVTDVQVRPADGAVLHLLDQPLSETRVEGLIDWPRRRDHLQQHTGQHVLSQAFLRTASAATIGFHLGAEYVSIDLDLATADDRLLERTLEIANDAIRADLAVAAWFPTAAELATIPLRKTPDVDGALRIVAIGDFDVSACGGTHVARTGEVGLIHCLRTERLKRGVRVGFLCGDRARADYAEKHRIVSRLSAGLTCAVPELPDAVSRLQRELEATRRELSRHQDEALDREAEGLRASGSGGSPLVVRQAWAGRPAAELKGLALRLTTAPGTIALLGAGGDRSQFVLARSEDLAVDLKRALDAALAAVGGGKGGGGRIVQGGGGPASEADIARALAAAAAVTGG